MWKKPMCETEDFGEFEAWEKNFFCFPVSVSQTQDLSLQFQ